MKGGICPKCDVEKVIPNMLVQAGVSLAGKSPETGRLQVRLEQPPDPKKWIQTARSEEWTFHAWVCGECGYTEFYADDPAGLYDAYKDGWR